MSPCFFTLYAEYITRNVGLDELQAGIKTAGRSIINLRHEDDITLIAESEEELKNLFMQVKEESEKASLKLNIKKTKIMTYGPITSWQIEGDEMEAVTEFLFLGSKITVDGGMVTAAIKLKRQLLLGRKAMTNLDSVQRHHFADKGLYSQGYGLSSSHAWFSELDHKESIVPKS